MSKLKMRYTKEEKLSIVNESVVQDVDQSDGFIPANSQELPGAILTIEIGASHTVQPASGGMITVMNQAMDPLFPIDAVFEIPNCTL